MFVGLALMASATCRKSVSMPIGVVVLCVSFNQHSTSNKGCENRTGSSGLIGWIGPASGLSRLQNRSAHEPIIEPENRSKLEKNRKKPAVQNLNRFKKITYFFN
jgi:hypothetical protein